jgi:aryl-alcohol dehydrogenase-like predicted oxidoreductase
MRTTPQHPAPITPLLSASSLDQATENLGAATPELSQEHWTRPDLAGI